LTDTPEIQLYYQAGQEGGRLDAGPGLLERARTEALLAARLPAPPAVVLDVGGGTGRYARWLAGRGHEVHLVDPVPLHVDDARGHPGPALSSATVGDARALARAEESVDAVLLLGPLYHLTERRDRVRALAEARRVLRDGGIVAAAGISRYASLLDGLVRGFVHDPAFRDILARDLREGQHRNPTSRLEYFTTAYFHRPEELGEEAREAGLVVEALVAVEGPAWLVPDVGTLLADEEKRRTLLAVVAQVEADPALLPLSAHLLLFARKR
jgi:SAM-dependent methyltransferase